MLQRPPTGRQTHAPCRRASNGPLGVHQPAESNRYGCQGLAAHWVRRGDRTLSFGSRCFGTAARHTAAATVRRAAAALNFVRKVPRWGGCSDRAPEPRSAERQHQRHGMHETEQNQAARRTHNASLSSNYTAAGLRLLEQKQGWLLSASVGAMNICFDWQKGFKGAFGDLAQRQPTVAAKAV